MYLYSGSARKLLKRYLHTDHRTDDEALDGLQIAVRSILQPVKRRVTSLGRMHREVLIKEIYSIIFVILLSAGSCCSTFQRWPETLY
jgi:hypothetical protein